MNKNDYRRALIMLRPARQGYSGHARLERRTLAGSLFFIVTAPEGSGTLEAALAGRRGGEYYAAPIGTLARDRRGQLTLAWRFDPRSVAGRPLEAYAWVTVVRTGDDGCGLALVGNLEGSREVDPAALEGAVCALYRPADAPAAELPGPEEAAPGVPRLEDFIPAPDAAPTAELPAPEEAAPDAPRLEDFIPVPDAAPTADLPAPEALPRSPAASEAGPTDGLPAPDALPPFAADPEDDAGDIKIYTGSRARRSAASAPEAAVPANADAVPRRAERRPEAEPQAPRHSEPAPSAREEAPSTPEEAAADPASGLPEGPLHGAGTNRDAASRVRPETAANRLGLDITRPWPGCAEPLRRLFASQAPVALSLPGDFTYVSAPLPGASGFTACLAGLTAEDGVPRRVRYALPAARSPFPPPGLEDYRWMDGIGDTGYWVLDAEVATN